MCTHVAGQKILAAGDIETEKHSSRAEQIEMQNISLFRRLATV